MVYFSCANAITNSQYSLFIIQIFCTPFDYCRTNIKRENSIIIFVLSITFACRNGTYIRDYFLYPLPRIPKFRETQLRQRFALCWEKLFEQPFFMVFERVELIGFGGDALLKGGKAVGDFLLLTQG